VAPGKRPGRAKRDVHCAEPYKQDRRAVQAYKESPGSPSPWTLPFLAASTRLNPWLPDFGARSCGIATPPIGAVWRMSPPQGACNVFLNGDSVIIQVVLTRSCCDLRSMFLQSNLLSGRAYEHECCNSYY
jgi:hypothetical protein